MRKKTVRLVALFLLAAMLAPVFGCGKADDGTIHLNFLRIGSDVIEAEVWKSTIAAFEAENPGIKINYDDAAIGEPMETKLNTLFNGNNGPDIIGHAILSVANRVELGHYAPIDEFYDNWDGKGDMIDSMLEAGSYKRHLYGLAYTATPYMFVYRKDYFEQAGLDPESPPETWEELRDMAYALTVKDENGNVTRAGFAMPSAGGNMIEYDNFVFTNSDRYVDENGNPTIYTDKKVESYEFLKSFINDVTMPYSNDGTNPFITGNAAMAVIGNSALASMLTNPDMVDKVGIAMPPSNTEKSCFNGVIMFFIGAQSTPEKQEAAFKFITFALSLENSLERSKKINMTVTRKSQIEDYIALNPLANAVRVQYIENGISMPRTVWAPKFQVIRNEMIQEMLYSGTSKSVEQILKEAQTRLEQEIAAMK